MFSSRLLLTYLLSCNSPRSLGVPTRIPSGLLPDSNLDPSYNASLPANELEYLVLRLFACVHHHHHHHHHHQKSSEIIRNHQKSSLSPFTHFNCSNQFSFVVYSLHGHAGSTCKVMSIIIIIIIIIIVIITSIFTSPVSGWHEGICCEGFRMLRMFVVL